MRDKKGRFKKGTMSGKNNPFHGKKHTEESKKKVSKSKKGQIPWMKGKHHSQKTKRKLKYLLILRYLRGEKFGFQKENKLGRKMPKGEKHPFWKGGKSFEPYTLDWTETLRRSIRERDNYICQLCSSYGNVVHHIDYDKKNCDPENLITLCVSCNSKVNFNRKYWVNYFVNLWKLK